MKDLANAHEYDGGGLLKDFVVLIIMEVKCELTIV